MDIFKTATEGLTPSPHSLQTTHAENALLLGDDSASVVTCIEDQGLYKALRDDVHQHVGPSTRLEHHLADSIAEELWRQARYALVETTALSVAIERDWDSVTKECPNADPAYRTYVAIRDRSARDTACLRASQDFETRSWRRSRADLATLHTSRTEPR